MLKEDYRFKTSINLLYRGIIGDMINSLYLITWIDNSKADQPHLKVELDILHIEFLNSVSKIIDSEAALHKIEPKELTKFKADLIAENSDLYDFDKLGWKKLSQEKDSFKSQSQESKKILNIGLANIVSGEALFSDFKYLAQFQHFTPKMHDFMLSDATYDVQIYDSVLRTMLVNCECLIYILNFEHKEEFKQKFLSTVFQLYPPKAES